MVLGLSNKDSAVFNQLSDSDKNLALYNMIMERLNAMDTRYKVVTDTHKTLIKDIEKAQKEFEVVVIDLIETKKDHQDFDKVQTEFRKIATMLIAHTARHEHTLKIAQEIINHPFHLEVINKYLPYLPPEIIKATNLDIIIQHTTHIYEIINKHLNNGLIAYNIQQIDFLGKFISNYSILEYIEYDTAYKAQKNKYEELQKELHPILEPLNNFARLILEYAKHPEKLSQEHKKAYAIGLLCISGAALITGIMPAAMITGGAIEGIVLFLEGSEKYTGFALSCKDAVESTHALLSK